MGKYSITLDRDLPFGTVGGEPVKYGDKIPVFCQNRMYFTADGNVVEEMLTKAQRDELDAAEVKLQALETAKEEARSVLERAGFNLDEVDLTVIARKNVAASSAAVEKEIDLQAWARGEIRPPWTKVRDAFKKQHNFAPQDKQTAVDFLNGEVAGVKAPGAVTVT
jgi:hypothetical protein